VADGIAENVGTVEAMLRTLRVRPDPAEGAARRRQTWDPFRRAAGRAAFTASA
jgi:hypothetical protein